MMTSRPATRRRAIRAGLALAIALACGCRGGANKESDAPAPARRVSFARVTFDPRGVSPPLRVTVPHGTRSLAVMVRGDDDALYALARLETADGVEHVALPGDVDLTEAMPAAYFRDRSGEMPGHLRQSVRLGLFSHVFPDRPGVALPAGDATLRIATSSPSKPAEVQVLLPEDSGGRLLPVNLFLVSRQAQDARAGELPFVARLESILADGGIDLRVERVVSLPHMQFATMTELSEPQEPPSSASARLALAGGAAVEGDALNLFVVDWLPAGVGGWTLGTPGPPVPDTVYSGVVAARLDNGRELARVLAHEICHYLGLWHVQHRSRAGALHTDPLDDTGPGSGNLMDEQGRGTALTPDQSFVLTRHPLLRTPR
jgi:hypothetical protein